jgi:hypothetical protein
MIENAIQPYWRNNKLFGKSRVLVPHDAQIPMREFGCIYLEWGDAAQ